MLRSKGSLSKAINDNLRLLENKPFAVDGFKFIEDDEESFNPYNQESADAAGFPFRTGMPISTGFFYASEEYESYLDVLQENDLPHPFLSRGCDER